MNKATKCPKDFRFEEGFLGQINVPQDKFWGTQTTRNTQNFTISDQKLSLDLIHTLALVKHAVARAIVSFVPNPTIVKAIGDCWLKNKRIKKYEIKKNTK